MNVLEKRKLMKLVLHGIKNLSQALDGPRNDANSFVPSFWNERKRNVAAPIPFVFSH